MKDKDHFSVLTNDGKELLADAVVVAQVSTFSKVREKRNMDTEFMIM